MNQRHIIAAMAILASGAVVGVAGQQLTSAQPPTPTPVFRPITPCRLVDTRPGDDQVGPRDTKIGPAETHTVSSTQAATPCAGKIPADALALSLNVTALDATTGSFLTIWAGGTRPLAASLNPAPGQPPTPNAVTTELSVDKSFQIYNEVGGVNVVVDVNGFYVDHDHDDLYASWDHDHDDRYQAPVGLETRFDTRGAALTSSVNVTTHNFTVSTYTRADVQLTVDFTADIYGNGGECALTRNGDVISESIITLIGESGLSMTIPVSRTVTYSTPGATDDDVGLLCHRNSLPATFTVHNVAVSTVIAHRLGPPPRVLVLDPEVGG